MDGKAVGVVEGPVEGFFEGNGKVAIVCVAEAFREGNDDGFVEDVDDGSGETFAEG